MLTYSKTLTKINKLTNIKDKKISKDKIGYINIDHFSSF